MQAISYLFSISSSFDLLIILVWVLGIIIGVRICTNYHKGKEQYTSKSEIIKSIPLDDVKREKIKTYYRIYDVIIDVLPLLGTLGTVLALIMIATDINQLQTNFLFALSSTFYGLIGAITLKFFSAFIIDGILTKINSGEQNDKKNS